MVLFSRSRLLFARPSESFARMPELFACLTVPLASSEEFLAAGRLSLMHPFEFGTGEQRQDLPRPHWSAGMRHSIGRQGPERLV